MSADSKPVLAVEYVERETRMQVFLSPLVAAQLAIQSKAGSSELGTSIEVSSVGAAVFCNDAFDFDWDSINNPNVPIVPSVEFPHMYVIALIFPEDQTGSSGATLFDRSRVPKQMAREWAHIYPFLSEENNVGGRFTFFWTHTHPGSYGTTPSGTDITTFNDRGVLPVFVMLIINERFATPGFNEREHCSLKIGVRNAGVGCDGTLVPGQGIRRINYTNLPSGVRGITISGLSLYYFAAIFSEVHASIVSRKYPKEGWVVNVDDHQVTLPSPMAVKAVVNSTVPAKIVATESNKKNYGGKYLNDVTEEKTDKGIIRLRIPQRKYD